MFFPRDRDDEWRGSRAGCRGATPVVVIGGARDGTRPQHHHDRRDPSVRAWTRGLIGHVGDWDHEGPDGDRDCRGEGERCLVEREEVKPGVRVHAGSSCCRFSRAGVRFPYYRADFYRVSKEDQV